MDDTAERVKYQVEWYSNRQKKKSFNLFFKPKIPKWALENSIKYYAEGVDEDEVLVVFNFASSAKRGMLMTHRTLYSLCKKGEPMQIDLLDINNVRIKTKRSRILTINGIVFHKYSSFNEEEMRFFSRMLHGIRNEFEIKEVSELDKKKDDVLIRAKNWWLNKPDPKDGTFICDVCGGQIMEKAGTTLLGSYMRCRNCTYKLFSRWEEGED